MRILALTDEIYPDAIGGVGKSVYNECAAMARHGHEVTVAVRCLDHSLPPEETIDGIHIVRLHGPERASPLYYLHPIGSLIRFFRWLRRNARPYDILYIHNPLLVLSARFSGRGKIPIAYTFHAPIFEEVLIKVSNRKYGLLNPIAWAAANVLRFIEARALRRVDEALPRSRYTEERLRQLCPDAKIPQPLIPLGVDIQKYAPQPKSDMRKALNLPPEASILISVRRLDYRMGLPNLIAAMTGVRKRHPDALLLIAGKGPIRAALEEQIAALGLQDHVRLLGFVNETELPAYLRAADLFVLPTELLEGFGLATLEALSSGCPVIGTPIGATPEVLAPIEPSLLARDASSEALAERLCFWLDRREELPALGVRCREEVEARYDIDLVASRLEQRFRDLLPGA